MDENLDRAVFKAFAVPSQDWTESEKSAVLSAVLGCFLSGTQSANVSWLQVAEHYKTLIATPNSQLRDRRKQILIDCCLTPDRCLPVKFPPTIPLA